MKYGAISLAVAGLACITCLPGHVAAAPQAYGTQSGWGWMNVDREALTLSVDVRGVNGHICGVRAALINATSARDGDCHITLAPGQNGTLVVGIKPTEADRDACRGLCGARAAFAGDYLPLAPACTREGLQRDHDHGMASYAAKRFEAAHRAWSQSLQACEATMPWFQVWAWRNDIAVAALHLGRRDECARLSQSVLAELKGVTLPGETEPFTFAPSDAETAKPLIAAARHNLTTCRNAP